MDYHAVNESIKMVFKMLWWLITNFPGIIVPCIIAGILASIFHLNKNTRGLIENILGLFF